MKQLHSYYQLFVLDLIVMVFIWQCGTIVRLDNGLELVFVLLRPTAREDLYSSWSTRSCRFYQPSLVQTPFRAAHVFLKAGHPYSSYASYYGVTASSSQLFVVLRINFKKSIKPGLGNPGWHACCPVIQLTNMMRRLRSIPFGPQIYQRILQLCLHSFFCRRRHMVQVSESSFKIQPKVSGTKSSLNLGDVFYR